MTRDGSGDVPDTVVDDATGDPNPALRAPRGLDYRSLALGDGQVATEVVGDPHGSGSRRFVFRHAQVGGEQAGAHRPGRLVGPRPQVVRHVVGEVGGVGGGRLVRGD